MLNGEFLKNSSSTSQMKRGSTITGRRVVLRATEESESICTTAGGAERCRAVRSRYQYHPALPFRQIDHDGPVAVYDSHLPAAFVAMADEERDALVANGVKALLRWCLAVGANRAVVYVGDPSLVSEGLDLRRVLDRRGVAHLIMTLKNVELLAASQFNLIEVDDEIGPRVSAHSDWDSAVVCLAADEVADFRVFVQSDGQH